MTPRRPHLPLKKYASPLRVVAASRTSSESQASGVVGGVTPGSTGPSGLGPGHTSMKLATQNVNSCPAELFDQSSTFTVKRLNPSDVVLGEGKSVRVAVGVHREHEGTRIFGVRQAQGVSELMGRHQEQDVTCLSKDRLRGPPHLLTVQRWGGPTPAPSLSSAGTGRGDGTLTVI